MENIVLKKKSNKTSKAKVRLNHDQGPCVVGGFVWVKWNPPDQGSDWATTQETVLHSNLVSLTHHSPDTWFLQSIVPLDTISSGICLINLAS